MPKEPITDIPPETIPDNLTQPDPFEDLDMSDATTPEVKETPGEPPDPTKEPEKPAEEPEKPEEETPAEPGEYTEADLVKELGMGEHATVKDALAARDAAFVEQTKAMWNKYGLQLQGQTPAEINQELEYYTTQAAKEQTPAAPASKAKAEPQTDLSSIFKELEGKMDIDEPTKDLLGAFAKHITNTNKAELAEVQSRLDETLQRLEDNQDREWYRQAKAEAGDEPMPPEAEALGLLKTNPNLRAMAEYRRTVMGKHDANPMDDVVAQWRATKTATGLSKGEEAKRKEAAESVRKFKRQMTPGAVKPKKVTSPEQVPDKDLGEMLDAIKIEAVFPSGR